MPIEVTPAEIHIAPHPEFKWPDFKWKDKNPDPNIVRQACFGLQYREPQPIDAPSAELKHFIHRSQIQDALTGQWGIKDAEAARQFSEQSLTDGMHFPFFDTYLLGTRSVMALHQQNPTPEVIETEVNLQSAFLQHLFIFNGFNPTELTENFRKWIALYLDPQFLTVAPSLLPHTTRAWDLMRVEAVAGRAVACGWLSPEEGQSYAARAVAEMQKTFSTWQQAALSFWWGRAMWLSDEPINYNELTAFDPLFAKALTDPNSPWVKVPLRG